MSIVKGMDVGKNTEYERLGSTGRSLNELPSTKDDLSPTPSQ